MADSFFIKRGDKIQGPASLAQIKDLRSKLKPSDLIAKTATGPWTTWDKVEAKVFPVVEEVGFADLEIPTFQQLAIPPSVSWQPPPSQQPSAPKPTDVQTMLLYQANSKSAGVAYALWFLAGFFSGHRFYCGQIGSGVTQLLFTLAVFPLLLMPLPFPVIGGLVWVFNLTWIIADAFLIPGWIRKHNIELAEGPTSTATKTKKPSYIFLKILGISFGVLGLFALAYLVYGVTQARKDADTYKRNQEIIENFGERLR